MEDKKAKKINIYVKAEALARSEQIMKKTGLSFSALCSVAISEKYDREYT